MVQKMMDINCDLGEGLENDEQLMPLLDSCNIACGGHAGDESSIRKTIRLAKKYLVKIGAHPSYPDRENFGRKKLEISLSDLEDSITAQLKFFEKICEEEQAIFHHIKPHGALYNEATINPEIAGLLIQVMSNFPGVRLYAPPNSVIERLALENNIPIITEAFADRSYNSNLTLVSRSHSKALLTDPKEVLDHVQLMVSYGKVKTIDGELVPIKAETLCIHGDNPSAVEILKTIRANFNI